MKKCSNGAIVSHEELKVLAGALDCAIELVQMQINSDRRPNRQFHDDEYRLYMRSLKDSHRIYTKYLRNIKKVKR